MRVVMEREDGTSVVVTSEAQAEKLGFNPDLFKLACSPVVERITMDDETAYRLVEERETDAPV